MAQVAVIDLLNVVAQICRECPTPILIDAYVSAVRKFCSTSRWLKNTIPGSTAIGYELYSLGSDTYNEIIGIQAMSIQETVGDIHPLTDSNSTKWDRNDAQDVPEFYQYVPEGQFAVHPIPDAVYPLTVSVVLQPKNGVNSIDASLVVKWDICFQAGALEYLLKLPRMPWTDKAEALVQGRIFDGMCYQGLGNAERGYNAGAAHTGKSGGSSGAVRTSMLPI